ncbi:MAG: hypothetical protein N2C14_22735 [Planctomycetales bacterium]
MQFSARSLLITMLTVGAAFAFIRDDLQSHTWHAHDWAVGEHAVLG